MHELFMTSYGRMLSVASAMAPYNSWLTKRRSKWLRRRGEPKAALALLDRALADTPLDDRLLSERAHVVARMAHKHGLEMDVTRALEVIDEALTHLPDDPKLLVTRANTLLTLRRHRGAMEAWCCLRKRAPLNVTAWTGMARTLHLMDHEEQIEPLIDEYLGVLGDRPDRYVRAAHVAKAGQQASALEALLQRARASAHGNAASLRALAELQLKIGAIGETLNCLDEARKLTPEDSASKKMRSKTLRALRLTGIDAKTLLSHQRAALRMPDLALLTLFRRAHGPRRAPAASVVMICRSLGPGGVQRQVVNTVRGLRITDGSRPIVLMPLLYDDPDLHRFHGTNLASPSVEIEPCTGASVDMPRLRAVIGSDAEDLLGLVPRSLRADIGVLTSRLSSDPPEVVHAWGDRESVAAGVAALLAGVPRIILSVRSIAPTGSRVSPAYCHAVYSGLLDHPSIVLVANSVAGARTYADWLGIDPARIHVIYNGVDVDALERARDPEVTAGHRARLGLPANAKVVGSVFRLSREKRPLLWLEAAAAVAHRCPEAHFLILGDGPMRDDMAQAARRLGIAERLHMPGLAREVAPWYDLMDVVVLTSRYEGTSNAALEAQALGIPIVSPDVGGMAETFVPDVSGFLASAEPTAEELAGYTVRAITDDSWRAEAQSVARAFIRERFSIVRMVRETVDLYGVRVGGGSRDR